MTKTQSRLLKAFLISCAIELPVWLLLVVPRSPQMGPLVWHAYAYLIFEPLSARFGVTGTPFFPVGLFLVQAVLVTPLVYVVLRLAPWLGRKWIELTDDFLR
jgi:hypothetical protein